MSNFRYLLKSINLLNITLIIAICFLVRYSFYTGVNISESKTLLPAKKILPEEVGKTEEYQPPSISEFAVIAEQNIFHPERKIPADKISSPPVPPPEILLYGTLITGGERIAYVEDKKLPYSTPGRGKRQLALRIGNTISGYKLISIEAEKIELVKDEEKMTVYLIDSVKPKTREIHAHTSASPGSSEREMKQNPAIPPPQQGGPAPMKPPARR